MDLRHTRWVVRDDIWKDRIKGKTALIPCPNGCGTDDIRPALRPRGRRLLGASKGAKRQLCFYVCQRCMTSFHTKVQKMNPQITKAAMSK